MKKMRRALVKLEPFCDYFVFGLPILFWGAFLYVQAKKIVGHALAPPAEVGAVVLVIMALDTVLLLAGIILLFINCRRSKNKAIAVKENDRRQGD